MLDRVLTLPIADRAAFVQQQTTDDSRLRDEVMALLADLGTRGDLLDRPVLAHCRAVSGLGSATGASHRRLQGTGAAGLPNPCTRAACLKCVPASCVKQLWSPLNPRIAEAQIAWAECYRALGGAVFMKGMMLSIPVIRA